MIGCIKKKVNNITKEMVLVILFTLFLVVCAVGAIGTRQYLAGAIDLVIVIGLSFYAGRLFERRAAKKVSP